MKTLRNALVGGFAALLILAGAPPSFGQAASWKQVPIPPLHKFNPQQPRRIELPNGMVIFLQEDHELPLIRGDARIRGGSRDEPAAKIGLVTMYGQAWRTGGTKSKTGDELDDYLEARAAKVETGGGVDSTTISWDCLKENFDEVFPIFVELLKEPEFRQDKVALAKTQEDTGISRRNDSPFSIAFREASKIVFGPQSPYARVPEYATVGAVTREDLLAWHAARVHPNNIILGVVGDFDSQAMEAKLRDAFASWPRGPEVPKTEVEFHHPKPGLYFVEKSDVNESTVQMVDLGTTRDNPDYYAIEVFNEFFGGSFSSRLFSNIRSKKGLAYAVGGGIGTDFDHPGVLRLFMGTKSGTTAAAIEAFNAELDGLKNNPATPEELSKAKDAILNSFVFRFDSHEKVMSERMAYEFYGYPADFLEKYRAGIEKVTREDINRVIERYVHKDQLAVLVVGKAADFDKPISSFGPVTTLDITIPSPGGAKKTEAKATNAEGKALISKVIEGLGGAEKVAQVKAVREKVKLKVETPQGEMELDGEGYSVFPNRLIQKMTTPMGEVAMVVSPEASFMSMPSGTRELPDAQRKGMLEELWTDPLFVAQHADDPKFAFTAGGTEKVGDVEASILDVNANGTQVRWFVDSKTGRVLRSMAERAEMGPPAQEVSDYSDWRAVQGIEFAFKETRTRDGKIVSSEEAQEIEINPTVDPKLFEKPATPSGGNP
jgi:zinc protease